MELIVEMMMVFVSLLKIIVMRMRKN